MNIDIPKEKLSNYDYVLRWLKEDLKQPEQGQKKFDKVVRTDEAFNYKYAPLDKVIEATRKGLASNGLVIMQFPINEEDRVGVKTIVAHTSGEIIESQYSTSSYKKDPQGVGALLTYLRRYAYMAVC